MIKLILFAELAFFLIAGLHIVVHISDAARQEGVTSVLISLPLKDLGEIAFNGNFGS